MTIHDLKALLPWANLDEWHQHPNGGGWVENTASVDDTVCVGANAMVHEKAVVRDTVIINDHARISGNAIVSNRVMIEDYAQIFDYACVGGSARVGGYAMLSDTAQLFGTACALDHSAISGKTKVFGKSRLFGMTHLTDGEWPKSPLQIQGTHCFMHIDGPGGSLLCVDTERHPYIWWLQYGEQSFIARGMDAKQVEEYLAYVRLAARLYDNPQEVATCPIS